MINSQSNPGNSIFDIKRFVGRRFDHPEVQAAIKVWPHNMIVKREGKPYVRVDPRLGGKEFDRRLASHFVELVKKKYYGKDMARRLANHFVGLFKNVYYGKELFDKSALEKLVRECERAKIVLSGQDRVAVEIESLVKGLNFTELLTRKAFEDLNADLFDKITVLVNSALEEAGFEKSDIHGVALVGGSNRIPKMQKLFKDMFDGKEPNSCIVTHLAPDKVLLKGALSIYQWIWHNNGMLCKPNPISVSAGIQTFGGVTANIFRTNGHRPTTEKAFFTTNRDNQSTVEIKVLAGELRLGYVCREIERFNISGIIPAPRGEPRIEISFRLDDYNKFTVKAEDKASNVSVTKSFWYDESIECELDMAMEESVENEDRMLWLTKPETTLFPSHLHYNYSDWRAAFGYNLY